MEIVSALQQLGFGEYEARVYVALVQRSPLNGYEVAKAAGIPRANVYAVLDRLTARRAIVRVDEPSGTRFAPVPPAELFGRLGDEFRQVAADAGRALERLESAAEAPAVWNLRGYAAVIDQVRSAARDARESLVLAVWPAESAALAEESRAADERGVAITTLCMAACERECGACRGRVYRYRAATNEIPRRVVVVADESTVVAGEVTAGGEAHGVRTAQPLLVDVCGAAIRSSIALAAIVADLGARLETTLAPETLDALRAAAPSHDARDIVERMRALRTGP